MVSGAAEFSQSNYATLFTAKTNNVPIVIIGEAARATEGFSAVITAANSSIKEPKDLEGKRIATAALGSIGPVSINNWLKDKGINYESIQWVQMPFQDMGAALERNQIDAAWVVEPFVTIYTKQGGHRVIFDPFTGPNAGMPIAGYVSSEQFVKENPDVIEAFLKGVQEAGQLAKENPNLIREVLPTYTSLSKELINEISLQVYPTEVDVSQIERVAEAMRNTGALGADFDINSILYKP